MAEKKRDLNLDLIRSFALVAVLSMHYYDNSGFYNTVIDRPGDFVMAMVRMLCATCVPLFIMLTGWLCSGKKLSARYYIGILRIIELYVLSTLACIIFEALYLDSSLSLKYIVSGLINFELNGYAWYLLLYGGLFLMMPFLNMMYAGCATKGRKLLLTGTFFALSILPSLLNSYAHIYPLWWSKLYPICYYFTGAYLREYSKKISSLKYGLLLLSLLLLFCSYTQLRFHGSAVDFQAVFYDHYQVYVLTVLVFLFLGSLNMDKARSWLKTPYIKWQICLYRPICSPG